jgi:hypothetical protein
MPVSEKSPTVSRMPGYWSKNKTTYLFYKGTGESFDFPVFVCILYKQRIFQTGYLILNHTVDMASCLGSRILALILYFGFAAES